MTTRKTPDGLPVVTEKTFIEFLDRYDITHNDPEVTKRIERENPQIHRILMVGMQQAPTLEAREYYECGVQIVYELLRMQEARGAKR